MTPSPLATVKQPASKPTADSIVVASDTLPRSKVWGETDKAVSWQGAFAVYGGRGATASSTIVYEIEPGKRLGWHTDATEETQYIIAGHGKLYLEDGSTHAVARAACSCCRRRCATTSRTPARKRCARSLSSPPRCSPRTSTR
jgi:hypothetical protein